MMIAIFDSLRMAQGVFTTFGKLLFIYIIKIGSISIYVVNHILNQRFYDANYFWIFFTPKYHSSLGNLDLLSLIFKV